MYKVVNKFICTFHLIIPGFRLSSGCKHRKKLAHWPLLSHGKRDVIRASNSLIVHYQMHVHYEQGSSQVKPSVFTLVWNVQIIIHGFWIRPEMDLIFRQLLSSLEINCLLQFRANQYLFIPLTVWNTSDASCLMTWIISISTYKDTISFLKDPQSLLLLKIYQGFDLVSYIWFERMKYTSIS